MAYKIVSRKIKYRGIWIKVEELDIRLPDGRIGKWENVVSEDAVAIVALDKEKNIYLSKEWRSAWQRKIIQIPSGMCSSKIEKGILKQAHNELREEVGMDAKKWKNW